MGRFSGVVLYIILYQPNISLLTTEEIEENITFDDDVLRGGSFCGCLSYLICVLESADELLAQ